MHQTVMERCSVDVGAYMTKLEINLPHAGGTFPSPIGRLDHGTLVRLELKQMKRLPSEYLRRVSYDTVGHDDRINLNLVRLIARGRHGRVRKWG